MYISKAVIAGFYWTLGIVCLPVTAISVYGAFTEPSTAMILSCLFVFFLNIAMFKMPTHIEKNLSQ